MSKQVTPDDGSQPEKTGTKRDWKPGPVKPAGVSFSWGELEKNPDVQAGIQEELKKQDDENHTG